MSKFYFLFFIFIANFSVTAALNSCQVFDEATLGPKDLLFIENKGQITDAEGNHRKDILYVIKTKGINIFVCKNSLHYVFSKCNQPEQIQENINNHKTFKGGGDYSKKQTYITYRLDLIMDGANQNAVVRAEEYTGYYENYYNVPSQPKGILGVKSYTKITIGNLYPNIDWVLYINEGKLKYDFVVHNGADHKQINMIYKGADFVNIMADGVLQVNTPLGYIIEEQPYTYENKGGKMISSKFVRQENGGIGFNINTTETSNDLVIDPGIYWGTYYGSNENEDGRSVCVDKSNNVYMVGVTNSLNKISFNGYQDTIAGDNDAYFVKFNNKGVRLWATYYGGEDLDEGDDIIADDSAYLYIVGFTESKTNISYNGYKNTFSGEQDVFFAKFDSAGMRIWSSYYGGGSWDRAYTIRVDKRNNIYIGGYTQSGVGIASSQLYIHQKVKRLSSDGFLAKFTTNGKRLWGTYYGGDSDDWINSFAIDKLGYIYVVGRTTSTNYISDNGAKNIIGSYTDGFLAKLDSSGRRVWGTYYGGNNYDAFYAICVDDSTNSIYIAGGTYSNDSINLNGYQSNLGGVGDGVVARFNTNGTCLWSTYCGGDTLECFYSIAKDSEGNIYATGFSCSKTNISSGIYYDTISGDADVILVKYNSAGVKLWGSYLGGKYLDVGFEVAIDNNNDIYVSGSTKSNTGINYNGHQSKISGGTIYDAFLIKCFNDEWVDYNYIGKKEFCLQDTILLQLTKNSNMNFGNKYYFQISDSSGSFKTPNILASLSDSLKGSKIIKLPLPDTLKASSRYRVRIVTTSPSDTICRVDSITIHPQPKAEFTLNDSFKCPKTPELQFTNMSMASDGYKWYFGDGTTSDSISPYKIYARYGSYLIGLSSFNSKGCVDSVSKVFSMSPPPLAGFFIKDSNQCLNNNLFLFTNNSLISDSSLLTYYWDLGDSTVSNLASPIHSYSSYGNYRVKLLTFSALGCKDSTIQSIRVYPMPESSFSTDTAIQCFINNKFSFNNFSTIPYGTLSYVWDFGDSSNSSSISPSYSYNNIGSFNVQLKVLSNNLCSDSSSKIITVNGSPNAKIDVLKNNVCEGDTVVFETKHKSNDDKIQWLIGGVSNIYDTLYQLQLTSTENVRLIITSKEGCFDSSNTERAMFRDKPVKPILSTRNNLIDAGIGYASYQWYKGGQKISNETNQVYYILENDLYFCNVTNDNGCEELSDTVNFTSISVNQIPKCFFDIYPNPNNGQFTINFNSNNSDKLISIYDLQGRLVYQKQTAESYCVFDLSNFLCGIFVIKVNENENVYLARIAIK